MISDFSEMDNSVFSTQTKGNGIRSLRDIPDDNTMFKEPLPKVTLSRISGVSFRDRTLDMTDGLSPPNGGSEANERSSPSKSSPTNGNRTYGNIYDKTFSSSFIGNQHPHYDSINESAFEATHILEHDNKSKQRDEGQGSQYELDRLRSRLMAMEKLHTMMKNEVEIYRKMADQNKAKSDSPLLQHLEELRQTRLNLERELREKEKDFETGKLSPFKVNGYSFRGSNYHFFNCCLLYKLGSSHKGKNLLPVEQIHSFKSRLHFGKTLQTGSHEYCLPFETWPKKMRYTQTRYGKLFFEESTLLGKQKSSNELLWGSFTLHAIHCSLHF